MKKFNDNLIGLKAVIKQGDKIAVHFVNMLFTNLSGHLESNLLWIHRWFACFQFIRSNQSAARLI
jgi:hypothetical protein